MSVGIRIDEIKHMLSKLLQDGISAGDDDGYTKVEVKSVIRGMVLNMLLRMLVGKRYYNGKGQVMDSEEARQYTDIITEAIELFITLDPADVLHVLRWIDYGGFLKRNKQLAKKADAFLQGLIDEHTSEEVNVHKNTEDQPLINRLLSLQKFEPELYSNETIKDTSTTAMKCAVSELLKNPDVMNKVRSEMENQTGQENLIDELDLPRIQTLQNVILETLRIRACPEAMMGNRMMGLVLGPLIQCFDWKQVCHEEQPLEAMYKPRPIITKILSSTRSL
uniref:Uncharacterized protein n=1 Tax=Chenopodium quinoa TaxID=63459 RepID=A0A803N2U7_CHEQI